MLRVLIKIALVNTHMFLWRIEENYPIIIIKYPPYLFHCQASLGEIDIPRLGANNLNPDQTPDRGF